MMTSVGTPHPIVCAMDLAGAYLQVVSEFFEVIDRDDVSVISANFH